MGDPIVCLFLNQLQLLYKIYEGMGLFEFILNVSCTGDSGKFPARGPIVLCQTELRILFHYLNLS